jgi:hypothetical protein
MDDGEVTEEPRSFKDFRDCGLLWLFNTSVLHPRGFALGFHWANDADPELDEPIGWSIFGDGSEPWMFADGPAAPPHRTIDALFGAVEALLRPPVDANQLEIPGVG